MPTTDTTEKGRPGSGAADPAAACASTASASARGATVAADPGAPGLCATRHAADGRGAVTAETAGEASGRPAAAENRAARRLADAGARQWARPDVGSVFLAEGLRLGTARRREAVLGRGRRRARAGGHLLLQVLPRSRVAGACGSRRHRHCCRHGAAGRLRAPRRAPLSRHRERARRGRNRHPVFHVFRGALVVEPHSFHADLRAPRPRHRARGPAVDPPRFHLHCSARARRGLRDAGPSVNRREPADSAVRLPAAAERRPGVGRRPQEMAGADDPDARPHDVVPVGLGRDVPVLQRPDARDGDFPRVLGDVVHRPDARPRRSRRRDGSHARAVGPRGVRHAAGLCDLPRGGSALRRAHRPAVRIPAAHRGGTVGSGCRAGRRSPARDRCAGDRARVRHLARDVLLDQRLAHGRRVHGRICGLLCARAACGRQRAPSILPVLHPTAAGAVGIAARYARVIRRARPAVRVPGDCTHRAGDGLAAGAVRRVVPRPRVDRVARARHDRGGPVLRRRIFCRGGRGLVVGDPPRGGAPRRRGRPLRGVRAVLPGSAARLAAQRAGDASALGRRGPAHREPGAAAVPRRWPAGGGLALGPRAAPGDRRRGSVHRERLRRHAAAVSRGRRALMDRPGRVVGQRRRRCRHTPVAARARRSDARHARGPRLGPRDEHTR